MTLSISFRRHRRFTALRRSVVVTATTALLAPVGLLVTASTSYAAEPQFQLPFPCGQTWHGNNPNSSAHASPWEIDFNRGSGRDDLGDTVVAAAAGTVRTARHQGSDNGFGNLVRIEHGDGWFSYYAHLQSMSVSEGQSVTQGQVLGKVGNTSRPGNDISPHLHYEVRRGNGWPENIQPARFDGVRFGYPEGSVTSRNCGAPSIGEGSFVSNSANGQVFRIAGGAPLYVASWDAFGGPQPTSVVSTAYLDGLRDVPRDGTIVTAAQSGRSYRVAGGAPIYISTWDAVPGSHATITVDQYAVDRAGGAAPYNHLRARPADGTIITGGQSGRSYRVAGGAPIYISTWDAIPGSHAGTTVDQYAIDRAGSDHHTHLRARPADGTFITGGQSGQVFRIAGGAPLYVSTWSAFGGQQPTTVVDQYAIDRAGSDPHSHLNTYPSDGTFISGAQSGRVYRVENGIPTYVPSWTPYGGPQPTVVVDQAAIDHAGDPAPYNHLIK